MTIFNVLTLIGGLALFLFGMNTMGDGLVKVSGGKLEQILEKLTSKKIMAVITGLGVTAVIQSSSATTVMVVGFVNSGIMKLEQVVGIIMGANVGTTVTSWLLSLTGIQGSNVIVQMFKPSSFSPILAAIGIILIMATKGDSKKKDIGMILLGFAVLMFGMETMSDSVSPLKEDPNFTSLLTKFSNPILGLIAGAVLTAVIQSSSASVGILQALCSTGAVSFGAALPIIMGQNIGTCVTALISAVGANRNAKRAAMIHLYFNLIGTIVFMVAFYLVNAFVHFSFLEDAASPVGIAIVHSLFNIGCCVCWFPFSNFLVKLARLTIKEQGSELAETAENDTPKPLVALDDRFLDNPSFAMQLCRNAVAEMAQIARDAFVLGMETLTDFSAEKVERVVALEQQADVYEDTLGTYLVKLSSRNLSHKDSQDLSMLLHCINDFERISDHAVNLTESAEELQRKQTTLTPHGLVELTAFSHALQDILDETVSIFKEGRVEDARNIEPFEEVIDTLSMEMKKRHVRRLRKGICSTEAGLILEDIVIYYERVSDHCSNIAVCLIQIHEDSFETHEYISVTKEKESAWFQGEYQRLLKKYALPDQEKKGTVN